MNDEAIFVKTHGTYIQIQMDHTMISGDAHLPAEDKTYLQMLTDAIEDYLGGLGDECRINDEEHAEARDWIFNSHPRDDNSFEMIWRNFFPYITPDEARAALKKRFEQKSRRMRKKGRRDGYKRQSFRGRTKKAVHNSHDTGAGLAGRVAAGQEA